MFWQDIQRCVGLRTILHYEGLPLQCRHYQTSSIHHWMPEELLPSSWQPKLQTFSGCLPGSLTAPLRPAVVDWYWEHTLAQASFYRLQLNICQARKDFSIIQTCTSHLALSIGISKELFKIHTSVLSYKPSKWEMWPRHLYFVHPSDKSPSILTNVNVWSHS